MRMSTKHERKAVEHVAAVEAGDIAKLVRMDARKDER